MVGLLQRETETYAMTARQRRPRIFFGKAVMPTPSVFREK